MKTVLSLIVFFLAGCDSGDLERGCLTETLRGYEGYVPTRKLQFGIGGHEEARTLVLETFETSGPTPLFEACASEVDRKFSATHTANDMAAAWFTCVQINC